MDFSEYHAAKLIIAILVCSVSLTLYTLFVDKTTQRMSEDVQPEVMETTINDAVKNQQYPTLNVANQYVALNGSFDPMLNVQAIDNTTGADITYRVKIQGNVNTHETGVYTLFYTVTADNKLRAEKYAKVIVQ